ncbi:DUF4870 domain-containing protein [Luteimonas suaedae]|uniref:DUF4870 domain-containing protein n=1 Tax=Luteimonas suaedae TaxID=2605430 RepID=UPI002102A4BD|nr:DUF4870 domain-containing protein [Luteimonas suaedae]
MTDPHEDTPPPPSENTSGISAEQRQWAMFAHLSALLGGLITTGWAGGIGCFLGPLIIWLVKKETMPFVDDQAKEALNFNITLAGLFLILFMVGILTLGIGFIIVIPIMLIVGIAALVFIIIAAIKANEGVAYRYPVALRLIK